MHLARLRAENFRLFEHLSLQPHRRLNFIYGPNAAGKTSLLEAIFVLGRGKSFRGQSPAELAGAAGRHWALRTERAGDDDAPAERLGAAWAPDTGVALRTGSEAVSIASRVRQLPVQILEPEMHRLLQDGPAYRRSFLDWGVFHVEPAFWPAWRRFQRALRQRNQTLRQALPDAAVAAFEPELAAAATAVDGLRRAHLEAIAPRARALIGELLETGEWAFDLAAGWAAGRDYAGLLAAHRERDRRMGTSVEGPHRAELRIRAGGIPARQRVSRGQQKLLIAALLLAQAEAIQAATGAAPILLVDDLAAELAPAFLARFVQVLERYPGQLFVTAFEAPPRATAAAPAAAFHVEHGCLTPAA